MSAGADLRLLRAAVFTAVCVTLSAAGHALASGGQSLPVWSLVPACAGVFAVAVPLAGRERSLPGIAGLLAAGQLVLHTLFSCGPQAAPHGGMANGGSGSGSAVKELAGQLLCNGPSSGGMSDAEAHRIVSDAGLSAGQAQQAAGRTPTGSGSSGMIGDALSGGGSPLDCLRTAAHAALSLLDIPMLLGHVLVAIALGWLLRRGEAALWQLVRLSARSAAATAAAATAVLRALHRAVAYAGALCAGLLPHAPAQGFAAGADEEPEPRRVLLHHSVHRRGPPGPADSRTSPAPAELALAA